MKLVPPSLPRSSFSFVLLVYIVVLVLVFYLCPLSVRVVANFSGTVILPLLCFVLPFFPYYIGSFLYLILLFQVNVSEIPSMLLLNVVPLFSPVPKLHFQNSVLL